MIATRKMRVPDRDRSQRPCLDRFVAVAVVAVTAIVWSLPAQAQKFYPDDPIWREPPPENTLDPQHVMISGLLEYFTNQFTSPGERQPEVGIIPAGNVNTVGGVPDSPWFTNRHGFRRMTLDELVAGPGSDDPPRTDAPWRVLTVKQYGDRTGMLMVDADNTIYLLRFDPKNYPELQTGAELVASKFYYAAGYNTTQNYLVNFERDRLVVGDGAEKITSQGDLRDLVADDIDRFLKLVAHDPTTGYRAVATRVPYQEVLGNYQFYAPAATIRTISFRTSIVAICVASGCFTPGWPTTSSIPPTRWRSWRPLAASSTSSDTSSISSRLSGPVTWE